MGTIPKPANLHVRKLTTQTIGSSLSAETTVTDAHGVDRGGGVHGVVVGDLQSYLQPSRRLLEKTEGL